MAREKDALAKALIEREAALRGRRSEEEALWQLLARYCVPRKAQFTEKTSSGNLRDRQILDSTAPRAVEQFAAFLHTSLNNPTHTWFDLITEDALDGSKKYVPDSTKRYIAEVKKAMMLAMTTGSARIYGALHELYLDLAVFGTGVLFVEPDPNLRGGLRIFNYFLGDVVVDEGDHGQIDFAIRKFCMTGRRARQRWPGAEVGKSIDDERADSGNYGAKEFPFLHACFPSTDEDLVKLIPADRKPRRPWPYYSVWINVQDQVTVAAGGYRNFPFMVPRWYKSGQRSVYGRSQAMTVLGDILMVNRMAETVLRGAEKLVDPPLVIPDGGIVSPVRLHAGGLTYAEPGFEIKALIPPGASRIEMGDALIEKRREDIREGFFVPLFVTPQSPVMTATQTLQIADERNKVTSPMVIRLQEELFDNLLRTVFEILDSQSALPPAPEELAAPLRPRYLSPIAASVKQVEALAMMRVFESLAPWAQVDDGVFDKIDTAQIPEIAVKGAGAPAELLRTDTQMRAIQRAKEEQVQAEQAMAAAIPAMEAGAKVQASQAAMLKAQRG